MKLSIGLMVKNEEKNIERCLKSLVPIMKKISSELIIVDTGSEDNTVEIARRYTDKIYFHKWNNNFAEMRNIVIGYTRGEWFFTIDADEEVIETEPIINFLNSKESEGVNTALLSIINIADSNNSKMDTEFESSRLFKKNKNFKYVGAVHNKPVVTEPIYNIKSHLKHYGYVTNDKEVMEEKFSRTSNILKSELKKNPEDIYYRYQLSVTYHMHKDYTEALEEILKAYNILKEKKLHERNYLYAYNQLTVCYLINGKLQKSIEVGLEALEYYKYNIDIYYYIAKSYFLSKQYESAAIYYEKFIEIIEKLNSGEIKKINSIVYYTLNKMEEVYLDLSVIYSNLNDKQKSLDYVNKICDLEVINNNIFHIIKLFIEFNKYEQLRQYYKEKKIMENKKYNLNFQKSLEREIYNCKLKEKIQIYKLFSDCDTNYGILNRVRIINKNDHDFMSQELYKQIEVLNFNELPEYYGDILYYFLKNKYKLSEVFLKLRTEFLLKFVIYLSKTYKDLSRYIIEYLKTSTNNKGVNQLRVNIVLESAVLLKDKVSEEEFEIIFNKYLDDGTSYLGKVYNEELIDNELIYDLKNEEEEFMLYMIKAEKIIDSNEIAYIKYLKKALKCCPYMKKGIELLLDNFKSKVKKENSELNEHKFMLKNNISKLIENNQIEQAKQVINKYESIVNKDIEIYSMKAVIAIMEEKLDYAEQILKEGILLDVNNFDLLYNLAYVYEKKNKYVEALMFYNLAKQNCQDKYMIYNLDEIIMEIKNIKNF